MWITHILAKRMTPTRMGRRRWYCVDYSHPREEDDGLTICLEYEDGLDYSHPREEDDPTMKSTYAAAAVGLLTSSRRG